MTVPAMLVVLGAVAAFIVAVWFGMFVLAPRIRRAIDRGDADEEDTGDRPD